MTDEERQAQSRPLGFWLTPYGERHLLFLPHGIDPADGAPLFRMRRATPYESDLWRRGKIKRLARHLQKLGLPVLTEARDTSTNGALITDPPPCSSRS